jgi:putative flippase GtrA
MSKFLKTPLSREVVVYVFFGFVTTVVSFVVYTVLIRMGVNLILTNTISHLVGILVAYTTNKIWVFKAHDFSAKNIIKEFLMFLAGRAATYVIDTLMLWVMIEVMYFNEILSKVFTSVVIIVLNYLASKKIVFRKNPEE